jgi:hypothetical protein
MCVLALEAKHNRTEPGELSGCSIILMESRFLKDYGICPDARRVMVNEAVKSRVRCLCKPVSG